MNVLPAISHLEHRRLVARALTLLANQFHVGQKLHLHRDRAVPLTNLASPSGNVEREMSRPTSALLRFRQGSEQVADGIECLDISDRVRSRSAPDRRLVDQHDFLDKLIALQTFPARAWPGRAIARLLFSLTAGPVKHLME